MKTCEKCKIWELNVFMAIDLENENFMYHLSPFKKVPTSAKKIQNI